MFGLNAIASQSSSSNRSNRIPLTLGIRSVIRNNQSRRYVYVLAILLICVSCAAASAHELIAIGGAPGAAAQINATSNDLNAIVVSEGGGNSVNDPAGRVMHGSWISRTTKQSVRSSADHTLTYAPNYPWSGDTQSSAQLFLDFYIIKNPRFGLEDTVPGEIRMRVGHSQSADATGAGGSLASMTWESRVSGGDLDETISGSQLRIDGFTTPNPLKVGVTSGLVSLNGMFTVGVNYHLFLAVNIRSANSTEDRFLYGDGGHTHSAGSLELIDPRLMSFSQIDGEDTYRVILGTYSPDPVWEVVHPDLFTPLPLPGDYDRDNDVDADDYIIWRNTFGQVVDMPYDHADGNGDGAIDASDYIVWRKNLVPQAVGAGVTTISSNEVTGVPEPSTVMGIFILVGCLPRVQRNRRGSKRTQFRFC
jgi:hypothetical protein